MKMRSDALAEGYNKNMNGDSELSIVVRARDEASSVIERVKAQLGNGLGGAMERAETGSKIFTAGIAAAGAAITGLGIAGVNSAASFEQSRIAFETMLGSADKARKMMQDIADFAKATPFELPDVVAGSKQLLAFGFAQEQIIPTMRKLGDIASGVGVPVGQLTNVFGQVRVAGRLMGQDLLQFTNAGVPLIEALAKTMGKPQEEIKKLVEQGNVGFPQVEAAINSLTSEGSKFGGMMEKQSHSFSGVVSNIKDGFGQALRSMVGITAAGDIIQGGLFDKIKQGAEALMPIVQRLPETLGKFFDVIAQYAPIIIGIIVGGMIPAFVAWGTAVWTAMAPLLPFIAAGAAIGAVVMLLVNHFGGWQAVLEKLKPTFEVIKTAAVYTFNLIKSIIQTVWPFVQKFGQIILDILKPAFEALGNTIKNVLWPALQQLWNFLEPVLKPLLIAIAAVIFGPMVIAIAALVAAVWLVVNVFNIFLQVAQWLFNNIIMPAINFIIVLFQTLWTVVSTVFNAISTVVQTVVGIIVGYFTILFNVYKFIFETIYAIAVWVWQGIYGAVIKPVIDAIVAAANWMWGVISGIWNAILNVARPIFDGVRNAAVGAWNGIVGAWNGAVNWFRGIFNSISSIASGVASGIGGFFSGAAGGIKSAFSSALNFVIDIANKVIRGYNSTVGKIPGTPNIGEIPKFKKGVTNFEGGLAYVHEGEMLTYLPKGTNVIPKNDVQQMAGGGGVTNQFYGNITLNDKTAVDEFFDRLNKNAELASMGVPT